MAYVDFKNSPSEETPLTGGDSGNLNVMQENGTTHGSDTKLGYSQAFLNNHIVNISNEVDEDYRVNLLKSKNLFDANNVLNEMGIASGGTITSATDNGLFYIPVVVGKTYVFSFTDNGVSGNIVWGYTSQAPASGVSCTYNVMTNENLNGATFTPTGTQKYLCIRLNTSANNQYKAMGNIQIEEGSTSTTYEAFIPNQIVVDDIKYTDTLNVGSVVDSRSRVNVLKGKNLLDLQFLQLITNSSGTVTTNLSAYNVILDTKNISSIYVSGDFTLLDSGTLRIGKYSTYPVVGSTGTRAGLTRSGSINTSSSNYILLSFIPYNPDNFANNIKASFMINEGSTALPYEPYITPSIYVDNEEIYSKPTVLWQNSSPTSAFASGSITLNDNLSNYSYYEVLTKTFATENNIITSGRIPSTFSGEISRLVKQLSRYRAFTNNNSSLTFSDAEGINTNATGSTTVNNQWLVPYQVIGYK